MGLFNFGKNPKTATKPDPQVGVVETVCPSCNNPVNLNPGTGQIFAGNAQQAQAPNASAKKNPQAQVFARRLPSNNAHAALFAINCPHCGNEYGWDVEVSIIGNAQAPAPAAPPNNAVAPAPVAHTEQTPAAVAAQSSCPNCGVVVEFDTETAELGNDATTQEEGYLLHCSACNTQFIEPLGTGDPNVIPASVSADAEAAFRAGIAAERERLFALDEMAAAAPSMASAILAAKRSGTSAEVMRQNLVRGMARGSIVANVNPATQFARALGNDVRASGVNSLRVPGHAAAPKSIKESAYAKYVEEYNKARGGKKDA